MRICRLILTLVLIGVPPAFAGARDLTQEPSTNEIVARLALRNFQRQTLLAGYQGMRLYSLENRKLHKQAEMLVRVKCEEDGSKHFEVVSEQGWKAAINHVFRKMLESEEKLSGPSEREKTELTEHNYNFRSVGTAELNGRQAYVLAVVPKRHDQFLFRGRVWIDAKDYALVRVEGEPAKKPSFWIRSIRFSHTYTKNGPFWFAARTQSATRVFFFGETEVTISYFDYRPHVFAPLNLELVDQVAVQ
jgi:Fe-S cluster biosynthesis and repair protein YggX